MGRGIAPWAVRPLAVAAVAGCLDAPDRGGGKPIDAGTGDGGDAQPGGVPDAASGVCATIFADGFGGTELGGAWVHVGPSQPTFDGEALTLSLTGFDTSTENRLIFQTNQFPNEVTVEMRASFETTGAGDMIFTLDDETGDDYYSLFVFDGLLRAFDSGDELCGPCPALVEGDTWGWRFHPMGDVMSFEADTGDGWEQIATAPMRFGLHRISLFVNTAVESDIAELRLDEFTIANCPE